MSFLAQSIPKPSGTRILSSISVYVSAMVGQRNEIKFVDQFPKPHINDRAVRCILVGKNIEYPHSPNL